MKNFLDVKNLESQTIKNLNHLKYTVYKYDIL